MSLALVLLVLGLVSGLARGGKVSNLGQVHLRYPALVPAGLVLQVGAEVTAGPRPSTRGIVVLCTSYVLMVAFVTANRRLPGALAIGAGLVLNLAVIAANGGMPVSIEAARVAGIEPGTYLHTAVKHREMLPGTPLGFLGDLIPIPYLRTVASIGDVVLAAGIFRLVDGLVRYQPRHRAARGVPLATLKEPPEPQERSA
jgi:uncharacterized protein DUF5317